MDYFMSYISTYRRLLIFKNLGMEGSSESNTLKTIMDNFWKNMSERDQKLAENFTKVMN